MSNSSIPNKCILCIVRSIRSPINLLDGGMILQKLPDWETALIQQLETNGHHFHIAFLLADLALMMKDAI